MRRRKRSPLPLRQSPQRLEVCVCSFVCFYLFIITVSFDNNIRFQWHSGGGILCSLTWTCCPASASAWLCVSVSSRLLAPLPRLSPHSLSSVFLLHSPSGLSRSFLSADQAPIVLRSCFDCRPWSMVGAFFCSVA